MKKNKNILNNLANPLIMLVCGLIIFGIFISLIIVTKNISIKIANEQNEQTLNFAAYSIKKYLDGAKNEVILLSKQNQIYKINNKSMLVSELKDINRKLLLLVDSFEVEIADALKLLYDLNSTAIYAKDTVKAFDRLVNKVLSLRFYEELESEFENEEHEEYKIAPETLPNIVFFIKARINLLCELLANIAIVGDYLKFYTKQVIEVPELAEYSLAVALDTGNIKKIVIKSVDGEELIGVDLANIQNTSNEDVRVLTKNNSFFNGNIGYSNKNKPYWWIAVPIKNADREMIACLTAFIDLTELAYIAEKKTAYTQIIITDNQKNTLFFDEKKQNNKININKIKAVLNLKENRISPYPDLLLNIETDVYKYLNDYYYECILTLVMLLLLGCYCFGYGILELKNNYNIETNRI